MLLTCFHPIFGDLFLDDLAREKLTARGTMVLLLGVTASATCGRNLNLNCNKKLNVDESQRSENSQRSERE